MYQLDKTQYDVLLLGTGLVESIVAAALAQAGKSVLHLDANDYYGGNWAAFNYKDLQTWLEERQANTLSTQATDSSLAPTFNKTNIQRYAKVTAQVLEWPSNDNDASMDESAPKLDTTNMDQLISNSRRFNLELAPKLLASNGELVDLLISSDIGKYLDFRLTDAIYLFTSSLELIPSSKEAVFSSNTLSLIEKRKLMKFLMFAAAYEGNEEILQGDKHQLYSEWLKENFKLDDRLAAAVEHAVTLKPPLADSVRANVGITYTRDYLRSYGRFGASTFLCPVYGGSEIIQAFCRVCAVFGGTYMLGQNVTQFNINSEENGEHISGAHLVNGQQITFNTLVTAIDYLPTNWKTFTSIVQHSMDTSQMATTMTRIICILDAPAMIESKKISIFTFPANSALGNKRAVAALQLDSDTQACPSGYWILYIWTMTSETTQQDLDLCKKQLFRLPDSDQSDNELKPRAMYIAQYKEQIRQTATETLTTRLPQGVHICGDPSAELDFDDAVKEARTIFHCIAPDAEFLPRAPPNDDDDDLV
ncbi:GDP dissociation inhibitor [Syncephalis fuscata]|nr:GDP dissociation inhibitor [Syncephalis fuscata]